MMDRFTRKQAAQYIGVAAATLAGWAVQGPHIPYYRYGNRTLYLKEDLDEFMASHRIDRRPKERSGK